MPDALIDADSTAKPTTEAAIDPFEDAVRITAAMTLQARFAQDSTTA